MKNASHRLAPSESGDSAGAGDEADVEDNQPPSVTSSKSNVSDNSGVCIDIIIKGINQNYCSFNCLKFNILQAFINMFRLCSKYNALWVIRKKLFSSRKTSDI